MSVSSAQLAVMLAYADSLCTNTFGGKCTWLTAAARAAIAENEDGQPRLWASSKRVTFDVDASTRVTCVAPQRGGPGLGLRVWSSAYVLCALLVDPSAIERGAEVGTTPTQQHASVVDYANWLLGERQVDVLELGCGVALPALVIAASGRARRVCMTDSTRATVLQASENARELVRTTSKAKGAEAFARLMRGEYVLGNQCELAVKIHHWATDRVMAVDSGAGAGAKAMAAGSLLDDGGGPFADRGPAIFDTIVAADVLYQSDAATTLPYVLRARLKPGGRALLVVRNSRTGDTLFPLFVNTCDRIGGLHVTIESNIALCAPPPPDVEAYAALRDAGVVDVGTTWQRFLGGFVAIRVVRDMAS
ncbi:hypothetical protein NFJ02_12g08820 [Pycnococcus provasolii]